LIYLFSKDEIKRIHKKEPTQMSTLTKQPARLLDKQNIHYELIPYAVDESDLSAVAVATKLGQNIEQVFKTLVLRAIKQVFCVCSSGGEEVD
jgi:prolyl-tRNA editing enzyme YbaK/EbsC (Cys-tRNA(Pro) deacylase)